MSSTKLAIGIVGLPNVGKSTLFRALTKKQVPAENYPFVTIEPNIGVVEVPDERVDRLTQFSNSKKTIHATVEFVDIAGLVRGAAEGQGLGNKFLAHIREVDAVAQVVRVFEDPDIIHVENRVDPIKDIEIIDLELIFKDLDTITKRPEGTGRQARSGEKAATIQKEILESLQQGLQAGKRAAKVLTPDTREEVVQLLNELSLLTAKPRIMVMNASEEQIQKKWAPSPELLAACGGDPWLTLSAKVEDELNSLAPEEKTEYLKSLGLEQSGLDRMIQIGYETLGLQTFLTTGEDETRAWTIPIGASAPRAGRAIHSDFEQKFIRAEVVAYEHLITAGSFARARELGQVRIEGKEYIVKDGDVIEFRV